jgi:cytochrome c biogenesis protein
VRFVWTQLTSMRTALVLLFALALAAIPGSLLPQRSVTPIRVSDYIAANPTLGRIYDALGLFSVYTSAWFSAIYLLLFLSLIGCIVPRAAVYARALRARPPATPRYLHRLPACERRDIPSGDLPQLITEAEQSLRRRRYRVVRESDGVAAERGYLREAGNLVFHLSLLLLLVGVAINGLFGFRGTSVVIVGQGFSNNLTQYDDIAAGASFRPEKLHPFTLVVNSFDVKFETGPVQRGAARLFRAEVSVTDSPGSPPRQEVLEVNQPLDIAGTSVHLIGHGYAPLVTVRDGNGDVAFAGPAVFLPQDGNFTSLGVIKVPDGRPQRLAFQGVFLPMAVTTGESAAPTSAFPDALNPALLLDVWVGPPRQETGRPENVYSLDITGLSQVMKKDSSTPLRFALQPGDTYELPDGLGSVTMDGWQRWVKLQIGDSPGMWLALTAVALAVVGLCLSLFIRPRRIWVRVRAGEGDAPTLEVAGLDRADARAGLGEDVVALAEEMTAHSRASTVDREGSR